MDESKINKFDRGEDIGETEGDTGRESQIQVARDLIGKYSKRYGESFVADARLTVWNFKDGIRVGLVLKNYDGEDEPPIALNDAALDEGQVKEIEQYFAALKMTLRDVAAASTRPETVKESKEDDPVLRAIRGMIDDYAKRVGKDFGKRTYLIAPRNGEGFDVGMVIKDIAGRPEAPIRLNMNALDAKQVQAIDEYYTEKQRPHEAGTKQFSIV